MNVSGRRRIPVALVHHANQYLITDGYAVRQGISTIVEGYDAALRFHERYRIPANVHLSGTVIEAIAWHCPWFLERLWELRAKGLVALVGGTYSENVMTEFSSTFNIRQLNESLWLYRRHLRCQPQDLTLCWIPERLWDTARLAPVLTSPKLANRGYQFVLLDDRLLYRTNGSYAGSPRALFDSSGPWAAWSGLAKRPRSAGLSELSVTSRVYRIAGGHGLIVVPMSANLRYWIPPAYPDHWRRLEETVEGLLHDGGDGILLVYADDLEKTAGVGGWDPSGLGRFDAFLQWLASREDVIPVLLPVWLAGQPALPARTMEAGTFFELAQCWQAGEDYRGWVESQAWQPYRRCFATAERALRRTGREAADTQLLTLARKHWLASTYELAWHDGTATTYAPAPWTKALASHARACLVIVAAARWFGQSVRPPSVEVMDIDGDDEQEVVLRNQHLYAVITPSRGGRVVYLFLLTSRGGTLVVGNPTDDWNFQVELNRYMDDPPNHPGALADVAHVHDVYRVSARGATPKHAFVELTNVSEDSPLLGARKGICLTSDSSALVACYRLPDGAPPMEIEASLSPDYYRLLREGRDGLKVYGGRTWRGFRHEDVAGWLGLAADENSHWGNPDPPEAGHAVNLRVEARLPHFHLVLGCQDTDEAKCQRVLGAGRDILHELSIPAPAVA